MIYHAYIQYPYNMYKRVGTHVDVRAFPRPHQSDETRLLYTYAVSLTHIVHAQAHILCYLRHYNILYYYYYYY